MSVLGQKQTFALEKAMSRYPETGNSRLLWNVTFVIANVWNGH